MFLWNTHSKKNTVVPGQSAKRWLLWLSKQQPKLRRSGLYRSRFRSICRLPLMKKKIAEAVRMVECILFLKICPQGIFQLLFKFNILCPSTLCSHSHPGNREFLPHFWWTLKLAAKKKYAILQPSHVGVTGGPGLATKGPGKESLVEMFIYCLYFSVCYLGKCYIPNGKRRYACCR